MSSEIDRLGKHFVTDMAIQFMLGDEIDLPAYERFKAFLQPESLAEEIVAARQFNKKVHIAARPVLVTCDRAKDSNSSSSVLACQSFNFGFPGA